MTMARHEENTKAAIDNSGSNPIEAYDREINRLEELKYTLGNEFVDKPNKEFLDLDLWKFLEGYPQVKADIDHFIRKRLAQLLTDLHNQWVNNVNVKTILQLEQQLKGKENGKGKE